MSTLDNLSKLCRLRAQTRSSAVSHAMRRAHAAVDYLHSHACHVQRAEVSSHHVIIHIDPPQSPWLKGAIYVRRVNGQHRETVYVARMMECQVRWTVTDEPLLLRREA